MKKVLESFLDKEIDVNCGGTMLSGKVLKVTDGVLHIEKDELTVYVNLEKIVAVAEARDRKGAGPAGLGFVKKGT